MTRVGAAALTAEVAAILGVAPLRGRPLDAGDRALARVYLPFGTVEPGAHYALYAGSAGAGTALRTAIASIDPDLAVAGIFGQGPEALGAARADVARHMVGAARLDPADVLRSRSPARNDRPAFRPTVNAALVGARARVP